MISTWIHASRWSVSKLFDFHSDFRWFHISCHMARLQVHPRVVVKAAAVVVGARRRLTIGPNGSRLAMVKMTLVALLMIASILTKTSVQKRIKWHRFPSVDLIACLHQGTPPNSQVKKYREPIAWIYIFDVQHIFLSTLSLHSWYLSYYVQFPNCDEVPRVSSRFKWWNLMGSP